ncbi:hypothetical protein [Rubellicoccus peritrichatus]|uniref:Uncharacterized protein n=1 Tax=Rubellicoccus peritrichatus TaxID=3080537 RepID=A0AAQ3QQV1_9BACT|nr:hypothetical protein [Puniceicoccus sp. CR14]WOO40643.1 hypothetical protein RZN69_18635 [Puniceicoccus sp. CR14]
MFSPRRDPKDTDETELRISISSRYRMVCLAYCVGWELHLHGDTFWSEIHKFIAKGDKFSFLARANLQLYEEGPTSVAEGKAVLNRLKGHLANRQEAKRAKDALLALIPDSKKKAAEAHPFLQGWGKNNMGKSTPPWFAGGFSHTNEIATEHKRLFPEIDREADFHEFLQIPGFTKAFDHYWGKPPKKRTNKETRALITISAICAFGFKMNDTVIRQKLAQTLSQEFHFSLQTTEDVMTIADHLDKRKMEPDQLAVRLITDASPIDAKSIAELLPRISQGQDEQWEKFLSAYRWMAPE